MGALRLPSGTAPGMIASCLSYLLLMWSNAPGSCFLPPLSALSSLMGFVSPAFFSAPLALLFPPTAMCRLCLCVRDTWIQCLNIYFLCICAAICAYTSESNTQKLFCTNQCPFFLKIHVCSVIYSLNIFILTVSVIMKKRVTFITEIFLVSTHTTVISQNISVIHSQQSYHHNIKNDVMPKFSLT